MALYKSFTCGPYALYFADLVTIAPTVMFESSYLCLNDLAHYFWEVSWGLHHHISMGDVHASAERN